MNNTSKPVECTGDQLLLTEAYALLRQWRFSLRPGTAVMTPRAQEEMRVALGDFCERYEKGLFPRGTGDSHKETQKTKGER